MASSSNPKRVVQNRRLLMERKVEMLILEAPQFADELARRHWMRILHYAEPASIAIVKEFYANARHFSDGEEPFFSYVRGRRVPFDAATINTFLNTQWPEDTASCEFAAARANRFREVDFGDVERVLCIQGGHFYRNLQDKPLNIKRAFLQPLYKYWVVLLHANISPCSHVSDLIASRAVLLYHIIQGRQEIFDCAQTANSKAPLGHPSLITHLCELAGAINRIGRAQAEMMRQAFGASHPDFMTPAEYDAFVAWPGDQAPTAGGGGSSSGAQAMEEDGTEVEDIEDDEDDYDEDDYEEDDSDAGTEILDLDEDEDDD
ncbi:hypothetical protein V8G54_019640 [Vigna mungo]|uniref:Putative plant transposon protein domain-containing protein n=1 Tax=Vigna mungo TaxID=3915 RepID=A0AAQ3RSL1_VIGMU